MKQSLRFLLAILALFTFTSETSLGAGDRSGFFLDETFFPVYVNKNDTSSFNTAPGVATESGSGYDLRTTVGYVINSQFLVGLTYNLYSLTTSRNSVVGGDSGFNESTKQSEMGPTFGYLKNGWRILFTYFISGEKSKQKKDLDESNVPVTDVTTKNTKLSGLQFSFGYTFAIGSNFEIGPSLVYKSLTYSNQARIDVMSTSGYEDAELYTKAVENTLSPMISMQLRF